MNKYVILALMLSACLGSAAGCTSQPEQSAIPFTEDQYYAAAYLGYQQIDDLTFYLEEYLNGEQPPVHYLSNGDYYLVIPRYSGMKLSLYRSDIETLQPALIYEDPDCEPFIIQCNASDIFADATVKLTYEGETVEFSPFISLKDGSVDIGSQGLDLTQNTNS